MKRIFIFVAVLASAMGIAYAGNGASAQSGSSSASLAQSGVQSSVSNTINFPSDSQTTSTINSTSASTSSNTNAVNYSGGLSTNSNVNYSGSQTIKNVPAVMAPNLTNSITEMCAGSVSGGLAGPGGGLTLGMTTANDGCERRLDAAIMAKLGMPQLSFNIMCQDPIVFTASQGTSHECPARSKKQEEMKVANEKYTDPYIRERLGLPALPASEAAPQ